MADSSLRQRVGVLLNLDQTIAKVDSTLDRLVDGLETLGSPLRVPDQVRKLGGRLTGRESDAPPEADA